MDAELKALADVSASLDEADVALGEGRHLAAGAALDRAEEGLAWLRAGWPELAAVARRVVGPAGAQASERLDVLRRRLPARTALADSAPESDPEQDADPLARAAPESDPEQDADPLARTAPESDPEQDADPLARTAP